MKNKSSKISASQPLDSLIAGRWVAHNSKVAVMNPVDGSTLAQVSSATPDDCLSAVDAAQSAFN